MRKAVFLDRDGVINEGGQINKPEEVTVFPRAADAIKRLKEAGYAIVVVTNQGGLGEGYDGRVLWRRAPLNRHDLEHIHQEMLRQLGPGDEPIANKFRPPAKNNNYNSRQPKPGMLRSAARELDLQLEGSY